MKKKTKIETVLKTKPKLKLTKQVSKGGLEFTKVSLQSPLNTIGASETPEPSTSITTTEYAKWVTAFNHFNDKLFGGKLPEPLICYQRKTQARGYFWADCLTDRADESKKRPELALNPDHFRDRTDKDIAGTLGHEMIHLKQHCFGTPSKRGYHNKEWAAMMKQIGLMPSNTGAVGGRETGQKMSHYIIPDAPFEKAFAELEATGWRLDLQSSIREGGNKKKSDNKLTYLCPACEDTTAFGRPALNLICGDCLLQRITDMADMAGTGEDELAKVVDLVLAAQLQVKPVGSIEP